MYKVRGAQIRPSHVFTIYTHTCPLRRSQCPSFASGLAASNLRVARTSASLDRRAYVSTWLLATFIPEGDFFDLRLHDERIMAIGLQGPLQVLVSKLVLLSDQSSPSSPKVGFLVLCVLVDASGPSGVIVTQWRRPANRLGDIFEAGINLWEHSRRSNLQQ